MTKPELLTWFAALCEQSEHISAEVYFILRKEDSSEIVLADITDATQQEICASFLDSFNKTVIEKENQIINLSSADERNHAIYLYDIADYPSDLLLIKETIANSTRTYSFTSDSFNDIFGYLIKIGTEDKNFTIFRKHYPVSLIRKDKSFSLKRLGNDSRFVKVEEDILKLNFLTDFFIINGELYINNLNVLERYFDFHTVITNEAIRSIELIENSGLLVETESLRGDITKISFAKKLIKMASSSKVMNTIPNSIIIQFTKDNPVLQGRFSYNENGDKLLLKTKKERQLFLKILNEDILISELTHTYYDIVAKDEIE